MKDEIKKEILAAVKESNARGLLKNLQTLTIEELKMLNTPYEEKTFFIWAVETFITSKNENVLEIMMILVSFGAETDEGKKKLYGYIDKEIESTDDSIRLQNLFNPLNNRGFCIRSTLGLFTTVSDLEKSYPILMKINEREFPTVIQEWRETLQSWYGTLKKHLNLINDKKKTKEKMLIEMLDEKKFVKKDNVFGATLTLPPYLSECECLLFNRNNRRRNIENQIISYAEQLNSKESINYMSLGSGKLLQDFILIGTLILKNFEDINIILIEKAIDEDALRQFKFLSLVSAEKGFKLKISHYKSIQNYKDTNHEGEKKFHIITCIDFEDIRKNKGFSDVIQAHQLLDDLTGRFYFSFAYYDFCFTKQQCITQTTCEKYPKFFDDLKNKLIKENIFIGQEKIYYASTNLLWIFSEWIKIISTFKEIEDCKELHLTLLQPTKLCYFGNLTDENLEEFNQENLAYFLKLFLRIDISIHITLCDSIESFKEHLEKSKQKYHVINFIDFADSKEEAKKNIECLEKNMPNSVRSYFVQALNEKKTSWDEIKVEIIQPDQIWWKPIKVNIRWNDDKNKLGLFKVEITSLSSQKHQNGINEELNKKNNCIIS